MRVDTHPHARMSPTAMSRPPEPTPTEAPKTAAPGGVSDAAADPRKASGVIQKLESGHFNDVAALRLRLNHSDAIAAAGIELPEVATESAHPGQGFAKALAAYQAALPPAPAAETTELDGLGNVSPTVSDDPTTVGVEFDPLLDPVPVVTETLLDSLVDELDASGLSDTAPLDVAL